MEHTQIALSDEVRSTYSKYHGGVDWTRIAYQAHNSSPIQTSTLKLYASLDGSLTASQLDQQATLIETITLTAAQDQTVTLDQAPQNGPFRTFLAGALAQHDVSNVYLYAVTSSADPAAIISVQSLTAQVQVHGSYF
jgi:hypothetical protein